MAATAFKADVLLLNGSKEACNNQVQSLSVSIILSTRSKSQRQEAKADKNGDWQPNEAFELDVGPNIQTLSNKHVRNRDGIVGLLYVPQLAPDNTCLNDTASLVPANVTRLANLPARNCLLIAFAPWVSAPCTRSFLSQASEDDAVAMLFYRPDNSISKPPPANDVIWDLQDNDEWKSAHKFPVYAISGGFGAELMVQMSLYSGNLSDAPQGSRLTKLYDPNAIARVYGLVALENKRDSIPGLWVFLLVILAALVGIVAVSSIVMKFIQRRRRVSLRERITAGEVDLEMLGIKRLRVPQHLLDKMPLYTYDKDGHPGASGLTNLPTQPRTEPDTLQDLNSLSVPASSEQVPLASPAIYERLKSSFSQTTCPICLDDYISGESVVRELPCQHVFHPECIDSFLLQNSSLCPVCKTSVFPPGYCPELITDAMVRQERYAMRLRRQRATQGTALDDIESPYSINSRRRVIGNILRGRLGTSRSPRPETDRSPATEQTSPTQTPAASDSPGRREEMRRRAVAMLGNRRMAEDEERERDASRPKCERPTYI
ncbi:hypothetical protein PRK78_003788 [Emydomyces testavorans]|uniref:RING-type domain-containing protein n=1 Tax=Emydomyces testavorans TaxID=2070801 RepID=A0AAF0DGV5_9EURO|nr:hypothetical protein PRK78_003788 [Emydomyces testavorans]